MRRRVVVHHRLDAPEHVIGVALLGLLDLPEIKLVGGGLRRRHLLDLDDVLGLHESRDGSVGVVRRVLGVVAAVPVGIVLDCFDRKPALVPVLARNLDRLARDRHHAVHEIGKHEAPHPTVHAAHRGAEHEPQMPDVEMLGDQPMLRRDDVLIAVVRKFRAQAVARFRGAATADCGRQNDEIFRGIERLAGLEQLVGERGPQPVGARAAGAVQEHDPVDDLARRVALLGPERHVVQLQLGDVLPAREAEILDYEIARTLVRPLRLGKAGRRGEQNHGGGQDGQRGDGHRWSPCACGNRSRRL